MADELPDLPLPGSVPTPDPVGGDASEEEEQPGDAAQEAYREPAGQQQYEDEEEAYEEEEDVEVEGFEFIGAEQTVIAAPTRRRRSVDADEIERVEQEMRGRRRRRLLVIGGAILALFAVLGAGGFVLFAMARVNNARARFDDTMETCDVHTLQRYAASEFSEANRLAQDAAALNPLTESGKIEEKYKRAASVVQGAYAKATDRKSEYERFRKRFEELWTDAKDCRLEVHAPDAWAKVAPLEEMLQPDSSFDPVEATPRMEEAVKELEKLRKSYDAIKAFDKTYVEFAQTWEGLSKEAWRACLPDKWAEIETTEKAARELVKQYKWAEAENMFGAIQASLAQGYDTLERFRKDAEDATAGMKKTMEGVRQDEIKRFAPAVWEKIAVGLKRIDTDMAAFSYPSVISGAEETTKLVTDTVAAVADALGRRDKIVAELEELYKKASGNRRFYRKNWPDEWKQAEALYREARSLASKKEEHVALVQTASKAVELLQTLIVDGSNIQGNADKAKQVVATILKKIRHQLFQDNVPDLWEKAEEEVALGERNYRLENMSQATAAYVGARQTLEEAAKQLAELKASTEKLREQAASIQDEFFTSFSAFHPKEAGKASRLIRTADAHLQRSNWRLAKPELEEALEILPPGRFVSSDGVVTDYVEGLMWVADDTGPGGNNGKPMDWYEALSWVAKLELAGFTDWRLPTDEELHVLSAVPTNEYDALFKKTFDAAYWTRTDLIDNVKQAFYYDFTKSRSGLGNKRNDLHVRPVRAPRR